jgi:hypothetical protein
MRSRLLLAMLVLALPACVPTASLDNAPCPCLTGYYCAAGDVCKSRADLVTGLVGRKYIVTIAREQWTLPPKLAEDSRTDYSLEYPVFAFEVTQADPASMKFSVLLGTVRGGVQDRRNKTYVLDGMLAHGDDGTIAFVLGPKNMLSGIFGPTTNTLANFYEFTLTGRLTNQGQSVDSGSLGAVMKASEIYNLFYVVPPTSGEELCAEMAAYAQYDCTACPLEPSVSLCLKFEALGLSFPMAPDLVLGEVADFDPDSF